jgi:cbb3-type cytochrome oxidase subunit 3
MKQGVLMSWDLPGLSVLGLILFVLSFLFYTWWTYRQENKAVYDRIAHMPLEDETPSMRKEHE